MKENDYGTSRHNVKNAEEENAALSLFGRPLTIAKGHNDPEALKNGNRPLFRGLFLKPNCDQIGQKCLKFYFWTRQKTFQT